MKGFALAAFAALTLSVFATTDAKAQCGVRNNAQVSQSVLAPAPQIVQLPPVQAQAPIAANQSVTIPGRVALAPLAPVVVAAPQAVAAAQSANANARVVPVSTKKEGPVRRLLDKVSENRAERVTLRNGGTVVKQTTSISGV